MGKNEGESWGFFTIFSARVYLALVFILSIDEFNKNLCA